MDEKFGIPEMREFAAAHGDQRVYLIWLRLNEARTKNALWCSETVKLRAEVERLREGIKQHKKSATDAMDLCDGAADRELWALLETEAGGADS